MTGCMSIVVNGRRSFATYLNFRMRNGSTGLGGLGVSNCYGVLSRIIGICPGFGTVNAALHAIGATAVGS